MNREKLDKANGISFKIYDIENCLKDIDESLIKVNEGKNALKEINLCFVGVKQEDDIVIRLRGANLILKEPLFTLIIEELTKKLNKLKEQFEAL